MTDPCAIGPASDKPAPTRVPGVDANGRKIWIYQDGSVELGGIKGGGFDTEDEVTSDRANRLEVAAAHQYVGTYTPVPPFKEL